MPTFTHDVSCNRMRAGVALLHPAWRSSPHRLVLPRPATPTSGRSRRRRTSSRATSRICRSTATAGCSSARRRRWSPRPPRRSSGPFAGADGTLWAGSGNEGQVLKIGSDGKTSTFFDAAELEVHALAPAPNGGLYVGTSPDGKIYQVAADGTSKTFFDPDDKYIWALAADARGNVFAATGDKGVIYRITPDGKGALSTRRTPPTSSRSRSRRPATSSPAPNRPAGSSASTDRQGVRAARLAVPRDPRAAARRRRHDLRGRRQRRRRR